MTSNHSFQIEGGRDHVSDVCTICERVCPELDIDSMEKYDVINTNYTAGTTAGALRYSTINAYVRKILLPGRLRQFSYSI